MTISSLTPNANSTKVEQSKNEKVEKEEAAPSKLVVANRSRRGNTGEEEEEGGVVQQRQLSKSEQWWRVRALLETIELLDKLINFAGDGAVFQISDVSQASIGFSCSNFFPYFFVRFFFGITDVSCFRKSARVLELFVFDFVRM